MFKNTLICGKTAVYGQAFHRVAMLWLIKSPPSANPIITISPLPLRGLAETSQAAVRLDSLIVGGTRPLYNPAPQSTILPGDVCLPPDCSLPHKCLPLQGSALVSPHPLQPNLLLSSIFVYIVIILL